MTKEAYCDTNETVIKKMVSKLKIRNQWADVKIIDPQAGNGHLIHHLPIPKARIPQVVDYCELNAGRATRTHETTGATFQDFDFLTLSYSKKYDYAISVPPYTQKDWYYHTLKIYEHLKQNGQMIVLLPNKALDDDGFLKFCTEHCANISFIKEAACSYECNTFILEIIKTA